MVPKRCRHAGGSVHGRFPLGPLGTVVAICSVMATRLTWSSASSPPTDELLRGGVACWLFYRDNRALTCEVSVDALVGSTVRVTRLWDAESFAEVFAEPEDALHRHAEITSFLHESGWLLATRTTAPVAA
jgi:hypothetical protein